MSNGHGAGCAWERTTIAECEYRETHHYCPHPEHACTCPPQVVAAEQPQPLCAVHRRLEAAGSLECEIGNDCVACSLNERRELLQLIAPFAAEGNTEDSLTVLRRVVDFYATHVGDSRVVVSYPAMRERD